jgi:(2Fe-2S) ferredoxin
LGKGIKIPFLRENFLTPVRVITMGKKYQVLSDINLEGQLLGFISDELGKYKYLYLAMSSGDIRIKLDQDLHYSLMSSLVPGEQVRVSATRKINLHKNKIKLKAYQIQAVGFCPIPSRLPKTSATIMICQKSGCVKKGGKTLLAELEETLSDRNLLAKVKIQHTDCQKTCNNAPNCMLMIGKKRYTQVTPEAIVSLLERHLK